MTPADENDAAADATAPAGNAAPSPAATARRVMRAVDRASLATRQRDADGWPYPSLVLVALDHDASPLLLVSSLADHSRNILADGRVGLLFDGTAGLEEALGGPRVSVLGRALPTDLPRHRARFLARHPTAQLYAGFGDFGVLRIAVERVHLVAGFGRIHWLAGESVLLDTAAALALAEEEPALLAHLNAEQGALLDHCAQALLGRAGTGWRLTGIDPEGCDLRRGAAVARLDFAQPAATAQAARAALGQLGDQALHAAAHGTTPPPSR